jgi:Undecaprenyl-phosphate galactose phosphotransferase WbaP
VYRIHTPPNQAEQAHSQGRRRSPESTPAPTRRPHQRLRGAALLLGDLSLLPVAWMLAATLAGWLARASPEELNPLATRGGHGFLLAGGLLLVTLAVHGHSGRRTTFWEDVRETWRFVGLLALTHFAVNFFAQVGYTRTLTLLSWLLVALLLPVGRLLVREALIRVGGWQLPAIVVGNGEAAREVVRALAHERHMGIAVRGVTPFLLAREEPEPPRNAGAGNSSRAAVMSRYVAAAARQRGCATVVLALEPQMRGEAAALVNRLHAQQFEVFVVPTLSGLPVHGLQTQHFLSDDLLIMRLQHQLLSPSSRRLKRAMDLVLAATALLLLAPLLAWVAWRIHREDGGPVLFSQTRVGAGGRDFRMVKFRSMAQDAEAQLERWKTEQPDLYARYVANNFKLPDDPRLLRLGAWIRRSSVDELPQLWNVLCGDMSLVGPRPLLRRELPDYPADTLHLYARVRPGITGLWQVSGRSRTSFERRAALDSWYVRNWSLWIDWVVLLKTVHVVLTGRGAA